MKINICFLVLSMVLVSCTQSVEVSSTLTKRVINKTNKIIVNIINSEAGLADMKISPSDSVDIVLSKAKTAHLNSFEIGPIRQFWDIYSDIIYNLADTTSFRFLKSRYRYDRNLFFMDNAKFYIDESKRDSIYISCLSDGINIGVDANHTNIFYKLTITDELLPIMEKDYTMLEKFPKYYKRE